MALLLVAFGAEQHAPSSQALNPPCIKLGMKSVTAFKAHSIEHPSVKIFDTCNPTLAPVTVAIF